MSTSERFIGIDVSKTHLDLAIHATGKPWQVAYDAAEVKQVVKHLRTVAPTLIVLEATGGLEMRVVSALAAAQLPVAVVNPRQVRGPWRKRIDWMRRSWPTLRWPCSPRHGPCRMPLPSS